ncbi:MAG: hypothetical protein IJZ34_16450 [Lachnospiraceae bacterium]|nr:hypothetical protein [Lachnospiraceae bacterium]
MKKVVLIGDSIRIGYCEYVKEKYEEIAEVFYPNENCRFTTYVLLNLDYWKESMGCGDDVDCVHWNAGLWDVSERYHDGCLVPLEFYKDNVDRICRRIKLLFPNAKMIFATSTPVAELQYEKPYVFCRHNSNIEAYNAAAVEIVKKHGGEINDLYGLLKEAPIEYHSDATHYSTDKATEVLGNQVFSAISQSLNI